jgi:polysaccharide biosynthesis/export protein
MIGGRRVKGRFVAGALALGLLGAGCGAGIYDTYAYKNEYDPRKHEYVIGASDALSIQVYHQAELSTSGTVRPDGVITMPLIGDVIVAGKSPSQVREIVKQKLAQYVKADTPITVTVTGFNSYRFVVSGNVNKAGSYSQKYYVTVSEAIAMAGGLNKFAGDQIVILRQSKEGTMREIPISYKRITSGRRPDMDICIVNGDTLVVD